jgi:SAM-dependent methyltransferase
LVACRECGLLYRNPAERSFEVESIYERDCPSNDLLRALHDTQRPAYDDQAKRLSRFLPRGATVLEVGSYVGAFLAAARDQGLNASGVDINPSVNEFTRSLGFRVEDGELAEADATPVDAIAIWNTFDQLHDPRGAVAAAAARLKPGGVLAIRVPNGAFYRRARTSGGVTNLAINNLLTFPYRWGLNPRALGALVDSLGFRPIETVGDVLVPTADEWTRPWARAEERVAKWAVRTFTRSPAAFPWFELYAAAPESRA